MAFQELLKYFNDTIISTSFVRSAPVYPVTFCLYLNEALLPGKLLIKPSSLKDGYAEKIQKFIKFY